MSDEYKEMRIDGIDDSMNELTKHDDFYLQVCNEEIESLRQQLAQCEEGCRIKDEQIETLEQQLAAAQSACKLKDESLCWIAGQQTSGQIQCRATEALSIQPDDSTLKEWLGEPVAWKDTQARSRIIFPPMKPEEGDEGWSPLYSPKGMK